MTKQQILEQVIQKAIDGGYDTKGLRPKEFLMKFELGLGTGMIASRQFIFSHQFAKALWGEGSGYINAAPVGQPAVEPIWISPCKFHLMQMVIAEDPIKYLGEHI